MSASTPLTNDELKNYLLRYCTRELAPHFAVMLRGTWGSGKTWFIDRLRASLEEVHGKKVIYVSLYSVARTSDITDQFFQQLHPLLASGKVQKPWALLKTLVKGTLRVDLTGTATRTISSLAFRIFNNRPTRARPYWCSTTWSAAPCRPPSCLAT